MNKNKILVFLQKLPTTLAAILLITWSKPYSNETPLPQLWGYSFNMPARIGIAAIGAVFLYFSLFYRKSQKPKEIKIYDDEICPQCSKVFMAGYLPKDSLCSECKISLEPLKGFYERHPELKETE